MYERDKGMNKYGRRNSSDVKWNKTVGREQGRVKMEIRKG